MICLVVKVCSNNTIFKIDPKGSVYVEKNLCIWYGDCVKKCFGLEIHEVFLCIFTLQNIFSTRN